ncbi:MAG: hypothetical protein JSS27_20375 [Planctomycetes bacterium]|nr:hypothetical protein [Planctomycetota bacterium]
MSVQITAIGRPELPPLTLSDRFRYEVTYFMTPGGQAGVPKLPEGEYWVRLGEARDWLEAGCFELISPLASENKTEVELSEEHETFLEWLVAHGVEHVALRACY